MELGVPVCTLVLVRTRGTRCTRISRATEAWTHSANTIRPGDEVIGVARLAVMCASGSISVSVFLQ